LSISISLTKPPGGLERLKSWKGWNYWNHAEFAAFAELLRRAANRANGLPPPDARSTPTTYFKPGAPPQKRRGQRCKKNNEDILDHAGPATLTQLCFLQIN
jgi:hypothetical protein